MTSVLLPRAGRLVPWVFLGTLLLQFGVLIRFSHSPHFLPSSDDMKFYSDWATRIAGGKLTDGQAFYGLPGYAYLLAAIYKMVGFDPFIVGALQSVAFAGVGAVIFLLGVAVFSARGQDDSNEWMGIAVGGIASAGWALFVPAQVFTVILMPTVPVVLAYWSAVLWLIQRRKPSSLKVWFVLGTLIGLTAMVIATILFVAPMALFAIAKDAWETSNWRRRGVSIFLASLTLVSGLFLGTAPAWIHNYFVAHEPVLLSAHSGLNLYIGNNALANGYPKIPPGLRASQEGLLKDSITLAQSATGKHLKRFEVSRYWAEKANTWIREHRFAWLRLLLIKFENFWNAYQYDDLSTIKLLQASGVVFPGIRFGLVSALGLPGICLMAWKSPRSRWILAAVLLHLFALLSVFVTERYRLAAVPGLLLGASFGLFSLYGWMVQLRWSAIAGFLTATGVAAYFASVPRSDPSFWSLDHYTAGIRALDLSQMSTARKELETAYAYAPTSAEINFALGNYWFTNKEPARAKAFYRATLDLDGTHAGAFNNLAVIMLEEHQWEWAKKLLTRALAIEPEDAKAHYLLATALLESGDRDAARRENSEALRLKPEQREFQALGAKLSQP